MRIKGFDSDNFIEVGSLEMKRKDGRTITLQMRAIPLDFTDVCEDRIPSPAPPAKGFMRKESGKGFLRDPDTGKPVIHYDEQNPKYKVRSRTINRLHTTMMLVESLKIDPSIEFEVDREAFEDDKKGYDHEGYYSAIYDELRDFGFSIGDLAEMVGFMQELSNLDKKAVEEATEDFLPEGQQETE